MIFFSAVHTCTIEPEDIHLDKKRFNKKRKTKTHGLYRNIDQIYVILRVHLIVNAMHPC